MRNADTSAKSIGRHFKNLSWQSSGVRNPASVSPNPRPVNSRTDRHCSARGQVIITNPAIMSHSARIIQVVPSTINQLPSAFHRAGVVKIIPGTIHAAPSNLHGAIGIQKVSSATQIKPSSIHSAVIAKVIPNAVNQPPTCLHNSSTVEKIPRVARIEPSSMHCSRRIEVRP